MSPPRTTGSCDETRGPDADRYDVVVIGGAFAGSGFATLLARLRPGARILVVEGDERFGRKVGEATVEVSAYFLHRTLGLYDLLSRGHLPKHGLRFWFAGGDDARLGEMTEIGNDRMPLYPSFQLDRARLDEQLAGLAVAEGCELARPARVTRVETGWPRSRVVVERTGPDGPDEREVSARWVIDASGRHAFLARRLRLRRRTEDHPTTAVWGRWEGVADLDSPALLGADPRRPALPGVAPARRLATNHFCGYGWWSWLIPLAGGQTSIGVVWDKRLFTLPAGDGLADRYRRFLASRPGLRELIAEARLDTDDIHSYGHLPYTTTRYADRGWALVGDAAGFLDPYYSPGLDHAAISIWATARLVEDDLAGRLDDGALGARLELHNERFLRSYRRWLEALYLGKYEIFGDAELTAAAYMVDTALYYMGVVTPVHRSIENLQDPVFGRSHAAAELIWRGLRGFNRRMNRLARFRRAVGSYGRRNAGWRRLTGPPGLRLAALPMLGRGLKLWLAAELDFLGHRLRHGVPDDLDRPIALADTSPQSTP